MSPHPTVPDAPAIRTLRQWMTPRVTMDPAQAVLSLLNALGEAGYVVVAMNDPALVAAATEQAARMAECTEVDGSPTWRDGAEIAVAIRGAPARVSYQSRVMDWLLECFGPGITSDRVERVHRFWEEALELGQSAGCTATEAHQLVDYVFGRPVGELHQEIGGTLVCLAAFCAVHEINMDAEGERELARVWTKVEKIRAKHAAKPKFSPLPGATS